jgi:transglutaminase-like putative cysteine protease
MFLEIRHLTQYQYAEPVRESVMELWLQPQKSARQRLISFDLDLDPTAKLFSYVDCFGNAVYHFDQPQPHERLTIISKAAVETDAGPELPQNLDMGEWDRLKSEFVQGEWFDFLHPHGFAESTPALEAFIKAHSLDGAHLRDPLTAVRRLSGALYEALGYEAGITDADSPIDLALKAGKGVCQDFAHIMIAICRSWGIPARYVSGYLFTDRAAGDRSDPDATHAWVEVFLPSLRWVGFDPTNNVLTGERHVTVAVGRDYADVPPSRGVYKGDADSALMVAVSVRQARSAIAEPEFMRLSRPTVSSQRRAASGFDLQLQQQQQQQQQQ